MAGNTPSEAVSAFVEPIQKALGCFVAGKVTADSHDESREGVLTLNRNARVRLGGTTKVDIDMLMRYRIVEDDDPARGPWKVSTSGWIHNLYVAGEPIARYHWHPVSDSHAVRPHVHVRADKLHYPSGRVLIEDVLEFAQELGAKPCSPRKWTDAVKENREKFNRGATWGYGPG